MTIQDSQYRFRPSDLGKQCEHSGNTIVTSPDSGRVAPLQVSGAPSSRKVPIIPVSRDTPMFHGGSITHGTEYLLPQAFVQDPSHQLLGPSDQASIKVVTQQPPVYPDVDDLPSPTLSVEYTSSNEESQLPDDQYYHKLAHKCAHVNGNNLTSAMTQFPDPSGNVVSDRYFPFCILSPVTF